MRVVAVLGYSPPLKGGLHAVCAGRLAHAEALADADTVVVLSGEAELMHRAWSGPAVELVSDPLASTTAGNAAGIAAVARRVGATEVVLVTSRWHARRATLLLRAALRGAAIGVTTSSPPDSPTLRLRVRELACLAAAPVQALLLKSG